MILPAEQASPAAVARHYDELDPFYRELWGEDLHHGYWATGRESTATAVRALVDLVATRAGIGEGSDVCDVGCGYGGTARILAGDFGARVVGTTLSPAQHAIAAASGGGDRTRFVLGDWLDNDLPDTAFDTVVAIESTEHMADKPRFFAEAARVLRPGGRLAVCAWLAGEDVDGWRRRRLLEPICVEGRLPSMGTAGDYRAMIADAGLELVSYDDITHNVRRTWRHCTARLAGRLTKPSSWRYLLDARNRDRVFALTVPRIWLAYATGAMRYGLFVARRVALVLCAAVAFLLAPQSSAAQQRYTYPAPVAAAPPSLQPGSSPARACTARALPGCRAAADPVSRCAAADAGVCDLMRQASAYPVTLLYTFVGAIVGGAGLAAVGYGLGSFADDGGDFISPSEALGIVGFVVGYPIGGAVGAVRSARSAGLTPHTGTVVLTSFLSAAGGGLVALGVARAVPSGVATMAGALVHAVLTAGAAVETGR